MQPEGLKAVILDWAGTVVDFGSRAPMGAFVQAFKEYGVDISIDDARGPMGMAKWDHIRSDLLRGLGNRQQPFPVQRGRGDGVTYQNGPDPREASRAATFNQKTARPMTRDEGIRVPTRSFR